MAAEKKQRRPSGSVHKLRSGKWLARISDDSGARVSIGTFSTKKDADTAISQAVTAATRGEWVKPERGRRTVAEVAELWLDTKQGRRPKTLSFYRGTLDRYVLPTLGPMQVAKIDQLRIRRWLSELEATGLSPTTVGHAYAVLSQIMGAAVEGRMIAANPCTIRGARTRTAPRDRWPDVAEVLSLAGAVSDRYRALVLLAGFGGLRWGELAGLKRKNVDLDRRRVRVEEQVVQVDGRLIVGRPKTDAGVRDVALPEIVLAALQPHLKVHSEPGPDGLVFPAPGGGHLHHSNFHRRVWAPARASVGLEMIRFHDLRHAAGTLAAMTGATTKELMSRLGHATAEAALRYQHVAQGRDEAIADGIDRLADAAGSVDRKGTRGE